MFTNISNIKLSYHCTITVCVFWILNLVLLLNHDIRYEYLIQYSYIFCQYAQKLLSWYCALHIEFLQHGKAFCDWQKNIMIASFFLLYAIYCLCEVLMDSPIIMYFWKASNNTFKHAFMLTQHVPEVKIRMCKIFFFVWFRINDYS